MAGVLGRLCGDSVAPVASATLEDLGPAMTRDLVRLMLDRQGPEVTAIAKAVRSGAADKVDRRAHQLKGAVGNFALPDLVAVLAAVSRRDAIQGPDALAPLLAAASDAGRDVTRSLCALDDQAGLRTTAQ